MKRIRKKNLKNGMTLARVDLPFPQGALDVHKWDGQNEFSLSPRGGGFEIKLGVLEKFKFREATEQELTNPKYKAAWFDIEGTEPYPGFHADGRWNGWSMPSFELEVAKRICESAQFSWWRFHEPDDTFYTFWEDNAGDGIDGIYAYPGHDVEVDGTVKHVYAIGDGWCWTELDCEGCQKPGQEPHIGDCFVNRPYEESKSTKRVHGGRAAEERVHWAVIRQQRLKDLKGLWDMWGFGDNEDVSEPLYKWLCEEIKRG